MSGNQSYRLKGSRERIEREAQTRLDELLDPLTAIACYADACLVNLKRSDGTAEALGNALQEISAQAHRAGALVQQLRKLVSEAKTQLRSSDVVKS
jgi:C4-dicarboxylate-specific signal transduction histidine kinase